MSEFNMTQLDQDIDTLRDVFMTNSQREALARVQALASDHARLQAKLGKLQAMQARMRDPERQMVCDIIANGMDRETAGVGRYEVPDAQPAPAIDLEQFREAVESLRLGATRAEHHEECDRLLALIDGQATQRTEMCGGCGETNPDKRCLGCLHDFQPSKGEGVADG